MNPTPSVRPMRGTPSRVSSRRIPRYIKHRNAENWTASDPGTVYTGDIERKMFGKNSKRTASRNRRLVFVSEEHCDNLVEKYFTTLDRVEEEYGDDYGGGKVWDTDYETLTDEVKGLGESAFDTKYRSVYVKAVTPENVHSVTDGPIGDIAYKQDPSAFLDEVDEYIDDPEDAPWNVGDFIRVTDEDLEYLGCSESDIRKARKAAEKGDYGLLFDLWKEVWDPRYTPEEVYPQLEALGVPPELYRPDANPYRGSGRGSFNLGRGRR